MRSDRINRPGDIEFAQARSFPKPTGLYVDLELVDERSQIYSHPTLEALGELTDLCVGGIPWERVQGQEPAAGQWIVEVEPHGFGFSDDQEEVGDRRVRLGSPPMGGRVTVYGCARC